ncbi:MAG: hypothetical protein AABZ47_08525 [Planctomycetota bacterium]
MILCCVDNSGGQWQYACIDPDSPWGQCGQGSGAGCDTGCWVCPDDSILPGAEVFKDGRRWVRAHGSEFARDARGNLHDLKTGVTRKVPGQAMHYRVAPVYDQFGKECFGLDFCLGRPVCDDGENPLDPGNPSPSQNCGHGTEFPNCGCAEATNNRLKSLYGDCTVFTGIHWPMRDDTGDIQCRSIHQHGERVVIARSSRIHQAMFIRFGPCTGNLLVGLIGRVVTSRCLGSYQSQKKCTEFDPIPPDFYAAQLPGEPGVFERQRYFTTCKIDYLWDPNPILNYPKIRATFSMPHDDPRITNTKSLALRKIVGRASDGRVSFPRAVNALQPIVFDRLENEAITAPTATNNNFQMWSREWNGFSTSPDIASLPVVLSMPNCRMKHSRCPVRVDLVFCYVKVEASLVPMAECQALDHTGANPLYLTRSHLLVSGRIRIRARLGLRATMSGTCTLSRPWLSAPNNSVMITVGNEWRHYGGLLPSRVMPKVSPELDEIVYVYADGTRWTPPLDVTWLGMLGPSSNPAWGDCFQPTPTPRRCTRWALDFPSTTPVQKTMQYIASSLSFRLQDGATPKGIRLYGWPVLPQTRPSEPDQLYGGHVALSFCPSDNWPCIA